jgi:uncharacterized membrane protein
MIADQHPGGTVMPVVSGWQHAPVHDSIVHKDVTSIVGPVVTVSGTVVFCGCAFASTVPVAHPARSVSQDSTASASTSSFSFFIGSLLRGLYRIAAVA